MKYYENISAMQNGKPGCLPGVTYKIPFIQKYGMQKFENSIFCADDAPSGANL